MVGAVGPAPADAHEEVMLPGALLLMLKDLLNMLNASTQRNRGLSISLVKNNLQKRKRFPQPKRG